MGINWYLNRLKLMSLKEIIFFRIPQQYQFKIKGKIQKRKNYNTDSITLNPKYSLQDYNHLSIQGHIDINLEIYKFSFFNVEIDLEHPIDWCKDYKNNKSVKNRYYSNYDKQDFDEVGDIKYVFEPSRFYFLPFVALYGASNEDQKSTKVIYNILKDWSAQNPFLNSIHWTSGIEVAIRSINLIYTHIVLSTGGNLSNQLDILIKTIVLHSYQYLKNHLSLYSSANNHLAAELAGLNIISSYFSSQTIVNERTRWQKMLYREVLKQVNEDGVNMELCTHYHAEVLDHFFNAIKFIERSKNEVPINVLNRVKLMFNFINHVEYNGNKTIYGDNDEGYLIYPYLSDNFSIYNSLLLTANLEYGSTHKALNFDLRNYLIYGQSCMASNSLNVSRDLSDTIFKSSGYAFLYDHVNNTKVSFDFGAIGDNVSAAHGHSDIFHFTFDVDGNPILIDSGTFQYHSRFSNWRTYFRGASAHNTIAINGLDHAQQNSRMSWLNVPNTQLIDYNFSKDYSFLVAETDAFKKQNILHSRELNFDKTKQKLEIKDYIKLIDKKERSSTLAFYLNFNDSVALEHINNCIKIKTEHRVLTIKNDYFNLGKILRANNNSLLGWRSDKYGKKYKGQYFVLELKIKSSIEIKTTISY